MIELYVLYDSIQNSVFESQVLAPLIKKQRYQPDTTFIIVSFEKTVINYTPPAPIQLIQYPKFPFVGMLSIWHAHYHLKKLLNSLQPQHINITARGPFAGLICLHLNDYVNKIIIQARGLAEQEYLYTFRSTLNARTFSIINNIRKICITFRAWQLRTVERACYGFTKNINNEPKNIMFEAVTENLKQHLHTTYGTDLTAITIATDDIPEPISHYLKQQYTTEIRKQLGIPSNALVYCYSGSAKVWQCPEQIINFFESIYAQDPSTYFLILTNDLPIFEHLIKSKNFSDRSTILNAPSESLIKFLAAANYGIILREQHIINHVARPTKILEYQAAQLEVIKNF